METTARAATERRDSGRAADRSRVLRARVADDALARDRSRRSLARSAHWLSGGRRRVARAVEVPHRPDRHRPGARLGQLRRSRRVETSSGPRSSSVSSRATDAGASPAWHRRTDLDRLVADRRHWGRGQQLAEAKLGFLSVALCAFLLSWIVVRAAELLPDQARIRVLVRSPGRSSTLRSRWIQSETTFAAPSTLPSRVSSTAPSSTPT